jgi:cytoskeletal protein CcmA (bactofilin family)
MRSEITRIGPSVHLEGTLRCEEDLRLEGDIQGTVSVPAHRVVVGSSGQIRANIYARVIEVEGRVIGDLIGVERVVLAATGHVVGNIKAPRVSLENGVQFKGSIDMEPVSAADADSAAAKRKGPRPSAAAGPQLAPGSKASVSAS